MIWGHMIPVQIRTIPYYSYGVVANISACLADDSGASPDASVLCLWPNGEGTRLILRSVRELYVTSLRIRATAGSSPARHIQRSVA